MKPTLIDEVNRQATANRLATIEDRLAGNRSNADFEGSVAASWVEIDASGLGVVEYKGKKYKSIRLGSTSIPRGTLVQLSYSEGVYFSDW